MRVLVCGGRNYSDWRHVYGELDRINEGSKIKAIIVGMACGADRLAWNWANSRRIHVDEFHADWEKHGKAAGPIRNQEMLDHGMVDLVLAFPGGRGTADMVRRARAAGVPVKEARIIAARPAAGADEGR